MKQDLIKSTETRNYGITVWLSEKTPTPALINMPVKGFLTELSSML